ncbi:hypothetical protein CAEBREN_11174 [Caenorhabditis brenneri]|uniref:Serpentine Receptor, class Z n=1 Tax=Caenorhabditis brenneri TaxID=135651 RepID=G0NQ76_CAEBE|nr:hypothetical protein CAEBREN_11174 [Caenorhabditis brenneri]
MNVTRLFDREEFKDLVTHKSMLVYLIIFFILTIFFLILLPFYVYVNKVNKTRDESTLIFPITNHFFEMVKKVYFLFLYLIISIISARALHNNQYVVVIALLLIFLLVLALYIIIQVFYFLLAFLAIQRLLIYFLPSFENQIAKILKTIHKYIWCIYVTFAVKEVVGLFCYVYCIQTECEPEKTLMFDLFYISTFFFLNVLFILSAFFYIPITWSVSKLSNLTISNQNKPQRYIFFQMIVILIFKFLSIPAMLLMFYFGCPFSYVILFVAISDVIIVPLIIQVSYLGCNKRNIDILFRNFSLIKFFKVLLDISQESAVQPQLSLTNVSKYSAPAS